MTVTITQTDYFTGPGFENRAEKYADELTDEIKVNSGITVSRVNSMLMAMAIDGVPLVVDPKTGSLSHSGWRPPAVNAATPGAAKKSNHMKGAACDLYDPKGKIDEWAMWHASEGGLLEKIGLWLEHPESTPGWCHVQIFPPASGKRIFKVVAI